MKAQWPQTDWRPHFMFGTLSSTMAGNDALELLPPATWNGDDADAIMRRLIPCLAAGLRAPLPALQIKRRLPGRKAA